MAQSNLADAKNAKNDEFYTQYQDIEKEMNAYLEYNPNLFKNKVVLCPCDDPEWSNFTKYFAQNFEKLKLKKLISTSYAFASKGIKGKYIITTFERKNKNFDKNKVEIKGKNFTLDKDLTGDNHIDIADLNYKYLDGDGDFRSEEVTKLRDEADFIITNPPFSLFREFLAWILEANKKFIIIGNLNTVANKEVFPLIQENKIWLGATYFNGGAAYFIAPKELYDPQKMSSEKNAYMQDGNFYWRVNGIRWYTNVEHGVRHRPLQLMSEKDNLKFNTALKKNLKNKYEVEYYPKYENYDAIDIPFVSAIPDDYKGKMGVPVSFMDKYCPEQFEIIGIGIGALGKKLKIIPIPKEIDDALPGHSSVWRLYLMVGNKAVVPYSRIIIKHKKNKK